MQLLDGKKTAKDIKNEIAVEVQKIKDNGGKVPHLAAVIVGSNGASLTYVGSKVKSCQQIGFESTLVALPEETTQEQLLAKIKELNEDDDLDGYIVQLPLPKHIDEQKILMAIDPDKDVDGFHPANFGKMANKNTFNNILIITFEIFKTEYLIAFCSARSLEKGIITKASKAKIQIE